MSIAKSFISSVSLSATFTATDDTERVQKTTVFYGEKNNFPEYLDDLAESAPIHGALVNGIVWILAGKGFASTNSDASSKISKWKLDKSLNAIARDVKIHGGFFLEVIYALDETSISAVNHLPYSSCRFEIDQDTEKVIGVKYCRDWSKNQRKKTFIPRFDWSKRGSEPRQVIFVMSGSSDKHYYSKPGYMPALNYIELEREIGMYHINNIKNGFFPQMAMTIIGNVPETEEERIAAISQIQDQTGAREAGKAIISFAESAEQATKFEPFPLSDADKQYQFLDEVTTQKIMVAHNVTSPLLVGIRTGNNGLGSNKDEILTAWELFFGQVVEPMQRIICEPIEQLLAAMGVVASVSIIPNTPLKMLETPTQVKQSAANALDEFLSLGIDPPKGYFVLDVVSVDDQSTDIAHSQEVFMANVSSGTARPNASSMQDAEIDGVMFKTLYRLRGSENPERAFCKKVMSQNKLYRKEDIVAMSNKAVNPGFGPNGADTYDIWLYKGGANCHHFWQKEVYMSIDGAGIDVNNPNARQIAVKKAEQLGYKVRNEKEVAQLPIDMPFNGFLPK